MIMSGSLSSGASASSSGGGGDEAELEKALKSALEALETLHAEALPSASELTPSDEAPESATRYFSVDEAASMIPNLRRLFKKAHQALGQAYNEVILYKRLYTMQYEECSPHLEQAEEVLDQKVAAFEKCHRYWAQRLEAEGVILRDVQRGLVDFPYKSQALNEVFMLSWHLAEDGVFYFHEPDENYRARKPISLLPE
jgi:hypothetical protein